MPSRRFDAGTSAWIKTLTLGIVLLGIAVASEIFVHYRADLTRDRQFTLGRATTRALGDLPGPVTVRVLMSRDLPPRFSQARQRVLDLLREFKARSGGRLELVIQDPGRDSLARVAALSLGIREVFFEEQSRAGVRGRKGFFGLALLSGEKRELFPVLENVETLEYDLVVALKRLTGAARTLGIVEGSGDRRFRAPAEGGSPGAGSGFAANFSMLRARLEPLYFLQLQSPADSAIGGRVDVLLVAAPARLTETERFRIDQYAMTGKPVVFLAPGIEVDLSEGIEARPAENGYADLLAHYGMEVGRRLLLDPGGYEVARFGESEFPAAYPYWIAVSLPSLNAANPVSARLSSLSFPWTSAVHVDSAARPGARFEVLATTSPEARELSWPEAEALTLYARDLKEYPAGPGRAFPLVVLRTGPLTSFYPRPPDSLTGPPAAFLSRSREDARVLVISNALFASDFYAAYVPTDANLHLVLNALDQLALDPDLIGIRSRELEDRPLEEARAQRWKGALLAANMGLGPLLVLLLGLLAGMRRRRAESGRAA